MKIFTIGFTKKSAETFFTRLKDADVKRLVDVRLNNVSQLAGFTKKRDLQYFSSAIANITYVHEPRLAPTKDILDAYRKKRIDWQEYQRQFQQLLQERQPAKELRTADFDHACLLCSEPTPEHCHRRLVAEYLKREWETVQIEHL